MKTPVATPGAALATDALIALRQLARHVDDATSLAALPGGFPIRRKGQGLEVADVRDYVAGDDIRHLDRAATARTGRLHVRQFQEERDRVCLLVADMRSVMFWGLRRKLLSVAAAEALTLIGWQVVDSGGRVALLALTDGPVTVIPPRGRTRGMLAVIGGMVDAHKGALDTALLRQGPETPALEQGLTRADRLVPPGSEIIIASSFDEPGSGLADRLNALARRRSPRLILTTEAPNLPKGRYPVRLPDGRRLRLSLGATLDEGDTKTEVAGHEAQVLDAGTGVEEMARRLIGAGTAGTARRVA